MKTPPQNRQIQMHAASIFSTNLFASYGQMLLLISQPAERVYLTAGHCRKIAKHEV